MGLDIAAYQHAELNKEFTLRYNQINNMDTQEGEELMDSFMDELCGNHSLHIHSSYPEHSLPFKDDDCVKTSGERIGFKAGSYSSYNAWRNKLCQRAHAIDAEYLWDNSEAYQGKPFYELIDFSDCEGYIGHIVCKKLAEDFEEHYEKAKEFFNNSNELTDYHIGKYESFMKAFQLASEDGIVEFH